jgi:hypothetical protein
MTPYLAHRPTHYYRPLSCSLIDQSHRKFEPFYISLGRVPAKSGLPIWPICAILTSALPVFGRTTRLSQPDRSTDIVRLDPVGRCGHDAPWGPVFTPYEATCQRWGACPPFRHMEPLEAVIRFRWRPTVFLAGRSPGTGATTSSRRRLVISWPAAVPPKQHRPPPLLSQHWAQPQAGHLLHPSEKIRPSPHSGHFTLKASRAISRRGLGLNERADAASVGAA